MLRLMHVHAHPDDESSKGAATTAKYVAEGVDVHVVTCTGGERGLDPQPEHGPARRAGEHRRDPPPGDGAGPRDPRRHARTGWASSTPASPRATRRRRCPRAASPRSPLEVAAAPLVRLMREFRPHVVTTYDENGGYPHPDHIMCHEVVDGGVRGGRRPGPRTPTPGEPWQPLKLYYHHSLPPRRASRRCTRRCSRAGLESPYAERLAEWEPDPAHDARITTRVPCAEYFPVRDQALLAHATQIDPEGAWFACPARGAPGGLADRGLRAGATVACDDRDSRGRPVRRAARLTAVRRILQRVLLTEPSWGH